MNKKTDKLMIAAVARVDSTPELSNFSNVIFCEWENEDDHLRWVATADVNEIVHWAETIQRDVDSERDDY